MKMRMTGKAERKARHKFPKYVECTECKRGRIYPRVILGSDINNPKVEDIVYVCNMCKVSYDEFRERKSGIIFYNKED